jgi:hypothetical protein
MGTATDQKPAWTLPQTGTPSTGRFQAILILMEENNFPFTLKHIRLVGNIFQGPVYAAIPSKFLCIQPFTQPSASPERNLFIYR